MRRRRKGVEVVACPSLSNAPAGHRDRFLAAKAAMPQGFDGNRIGRLRLYFTIQASKPTGVVSMRGLAQPVSTTMRRISSSG